MTFFVASNHSGTIVMARILKRFLWVSRFSNQLFLCRACSPENRGELDRKELHLATRHTVFLASCLAGHPAKPRPPWARPLPNCVDHQNKRDDTTLGWAVQCGANRHSARERLPKTRCILCGSPGIAVTRTAPIDEGCSLKERTFLGSSRRFRVGNPQSLTTSAPVE